MNFHYCGILKILSMNHYEYNWYRNAKNCDTFTANWPKGSIENFKHGLQVISSRMIRLSA